MGHRRDAVEALRSYAHDLDAAYARGGTYRVGSSYQDGDGQIDSGLGAPQLGALVGYVVAVLVGVVAVTSVMLGVARDPHPKAAAPSADVVAVAPLDTPIETIGARAVRALSTLGDSHAASIVSVALDGDTAALPAVDTLIREIEVLASAVLDGDGDEFAASRLASAVNALELIVVPPGQDEDFTPPGQDEDFTPPGQDEDFTPPGQDEDFTPPGQDEDFTPPGQDEDFTPPGQDEDFTPPGQDEDFTPPGQDEDFTPPGQANHPGTTP